MRDGRGLEGLDSVSVRVGGPAVTLAVQPGAAAALPVSRQVDTPGLLHILTLTKYSFLYIFILLQMRHSSFAVGPAARSNWPAMRYSTIHLQSNTLNHNPPTVSFLYFCLHKYKATYNLINQNVHIFVAQ